MCDAIPRSEDMFPWKQGAGREMATPLKWTERLVFTSVNQVSGLYKHVTAVFKYIYIYDVTVYYMHPTTFHCCHSGSSSDSDEISLSDEDDENGLPACTPLAAFLTFKQETEKRRASQVQLETAGKVNKRKKNKLQRQF